MLLRCGEAFGQPPACGHGKGNQGVFHGLSIGDRDRARSGGYRRRQVRLCGGRTRRQFADIFGYAISV
jgi:hypothetical protein